MTTDGSDCREGAPLPQVMRAMRRAGLGPLAGRTGVGLVVVLDGLAAVLPAGSEAGWVTVPQIAAAAGRSERWTRHCLAVLEDAGIIQWDRGGIVGGRPTQSWVQVSRQALLDLAARSGPALDTLHAAQVRAGARRSA